MISRELAKPHFQIRNIYCISKKEVTNQGTIFVILIWKYKSPPQDYHCSFIIPFGNILFPMLAAVWLQYIQYCTSLQNIIILFANICVLFGSEAWPNPFWKYINPKLLAVRMLSRFSRSDFSPAYIYNTLSTLYMYVQINFV